MTPNDFECIKKERIKIIKFTNISQKIVIQRNYGLLDNIFKNEIF
jgi:hypothetical protein